MNKVLQSHLKKRLDRSTFTGLPLTLLVLAFGYVLLLFMGVVEDVVNSEAIVNLDLWVEGWITAHRSAGLTQVFWWITQLGSPYGIAVLGGLAALALFFTKHKTQRKDAVIFSFTLLGCFVATFAGKDWIARTRPVFHTYVENSYSFPSGHSSMSLVLYGLLVFFWMKRFPKAKHKSLLVVLAVLLVLLIGFSRIYLGVHYLSDVLGGLLLGLLWLILGVMTHELEEEK